MKKNSVMCMTPQMVSETLGLSFLFRDSVTNQTDKMKLGIKAQVNCHTNYDDPSFVWPLSVLHCCSH